MFRLAHRQATRNATIVPTLVAQLSVKLAVSATSTYGKIGLGFLQARLLYLLGLRPMINSATAAEIMGVDPGAVSRALTTLKQDGLITVSAGTVRRLKLSDRGLERWREIEVLALEREQRLLQGVSEKRIDGLVALLERLIENAEAVAKISLEADEILETSKEGIAATAPADSPPGLMRASSSRR